MFARGWRVPKLAQAGRVGGGKALRVWPRRVGVLRPGPLVRGGVPGPRVPGARPGQRGGRCAVRAGLGHCHWEDRDPPEAPVAPRAAQDLRDAVRQDSGQSPVTGSISQPSGVSPSSVSLVVAAPGAGCGFPESGAVQAAALLCDPPPRPSQGPGPRERPGPELPAWEPSSRDASFRAPSSQPNVSVSDAPFPPRPLPRRAGGGRNRTGKQAARGDRWTVDTACFAENFC